MEGPVSLRDLIRGYFEMMCTRPTMEDLARFTGTVPAHLQASFLAWLRSRASALETMGYRPSDGLLN